jgi:hypothetical protein
MTTGEKLIEAIQIFMAKDPKFYLAANHDVIYGPAYDLFTAEEIARLEELGWHKGEYEAIEYFC